MQVLKLFLILPFVAFAASNPGEVGNIADGKFKPTDWVTYAQLPKVQTTDETQTTLHSESVSDGEVFNIVITCNAKKSDGAKRATFKKSATIYRAGASASIEGSIVSSFDQPGGDYAATVDVDGTNWRVRVTGAASETVDWECLCVKQEFL